MLHEWLGQLQGAWRHLRARASEQRTTPGEDIGGAELYSRPLHAPPWSHFFSRSPEMLNVEDEVAGEGQGRLVVYSQDGTLCSVLLARLRQQSIMPLTEIIGREGFFTLVQLACDPVSAVPATNGKGLAEESIDDDSGDRWRSPFEAADLLAETGPGADLLLYLFPAQQGWSAEDERWYARLRALSAPVLPVMMLTESGASSARATAEKQLDPDALLDVLHRRLGVRPAAVVCAAPVGDETTPPTQPPADLLNLVERMLALRPRLAIALAQEVPCCRRLIATRVIRSGALVTALVGSEPIPLLDLPLHVAMHWKVALQLAAIYGRPGLDYRSREMAGAVTLNLVVRHIAQQGLKLLPLFGWLLSGALSALSTYLLGHALLRYYEEERFLPPLPPNWRNDWRDPLQKGWRRFFRVRLGWPRRDKR